MAWMIEVNKIYSGHALEVLKTFDDESINMCITSPPYWGLRDYKTNPVKWSDGWEGELGAEPDFNQYINHLCDIFDEVKRVLKDDGTCWVNLGDTYGGCSPNSSYGIKTKGETSFLKSVEHLQKTAHTRGKYSKSLLLLPFRFAIEMMNRGWTVRNVIIWQVLYIFIQDFLLSILLKNAHLVTMTFSMSMTMMMLATTRVFAGNQILF